MNRIPIVMNIPTLAMTTILALDSSTEACSCALWRDGVVTESFELLPRQHAQQLLPMIAALMQQQQVKFSELDAIAFGKGPGSFTGLRIAAGVVQGIAFAADLPVIPVSTLAAQAFEFAERHTQTTGDQWILSCLDARIEEVYWGLYQVDARGVLLSGEEYLTAPELITLSAIAVDSSVAVIGSGLNYVERMPQLLRNKFAVKDESLLPRSRYIVKIAASLWMQGFKGISPETVEPVYLRDKVTHS
jgi:tRNA threonylcarbamoyladenosine biosynthesis protein TsaB